MHIKKGDNVMITAGNDRGKKGKVIKTFPKLHMVIVEGMGMKKKHQRARKSNEKGQIIDIPHPMPMSKVMLMENGKPVRVGRKKMGDKMIRISRKSGNEI